MLLLVTIIVLMVIGFLRLNKRKNINAAYPNPLYYNNQSKSIAS